MNKLKRFLALFLALALCLSLLPTTLAFAADEDTQETTGEASSSYEPWAHGYRFVDILNWDPATDPYAEELVAEVPLQERISTYAATQANPDLIDDAQLYVISSSNYRNTDTNNGPWNGAMDYEEFSYNVFKFWQYADITGAGGRPTSGISAEVKEQVGSFEYGTIAIPIAAATNAAHKNGVLSIGEYFVPRNPQFTEEWLYQAEDGSYPYAKKLVDIANYYGFDGYFINQEESIPSSYVPLFRDMLKWMRDQGLYIQWYDSIGDGGSISYCNEFEDYNDSWVWNEEDGRVSDSIFLNYWYRSSALKDSKAHAESLGLDPYEVVFMGVEGGQWKFGTDIETRYNAVDENGQPYTSFAIWGSDWYQDQYDKADNDRYKVAYQWDVEERERIYFTSATENAGTYSTGEVTREDINVSGTINFQGFSKYVVEKSVISGTTFASDFNNGHGMQYFVNGEVSRDMEWSNLNIQDILPTWQWWIEADKVTVDMDWDYGTEFTRHQGAFPYTQVGAYNGGSSIVIYGELQESQLINLYKTELNVVSGSSIALTYNKVSADDASTMKIALTFKVDDSTTETVYLPIENSGKKTDGWTTATVDLSAYAGKTIAAISIDLSATEKVEGYQINLGRLVVSDGSNHTPTAPANVELAKRFDETDEIQLTWDLAEYTDVVNYHVYAVYADGTTRFVGGGYASNYYIQTLENEENVVALEVRAVGIDGSESTGTQVALASEGRVSNIRTVSENNQLTVTWTDPSEDFASVEVALNYWYSEKEDPASITVEKGVQTAALDIPLEDGTSYVLSVTTIQADGTRNETVNYFGDLADHYCEPYVGEARETSTLGTYILTSVPSSDWESMDIDINGTVTTYKRFGGSTTESVRVGTSGISNMVITVTDIYGNVSEPTTLSFLDGKPAELTAEFGADIIPDEALRIALKEKVGSTLGDLIDYKGALDLSGYAITDLTGLNILSGVTELDLSSTFISALTADVIASGVTKITLNNCGNLERVELDDRPNTALVLGYLPKLTKLSLKGYGNFDLDLSQCPELVNLYLNGTQMTKLDITANVKLHNFIISDSQIDTLTSANASAYTNTFYWVWDNSKMDLSDNTNEGALKNGINSFFAANEPEDEIDENESVLITSSSWSKYSGSSKVIDLGSVNLLSKVTFCNSYASLYGSSYSLKSAVVSVSEDGETYTQVATFESSGEDYDNTIELPAGTKGRYVKIETSQTSNFYTSDWTVYGYATAPKGFTYGGQTPAVIRDDVKGMTVAADNTIYQMLDLLDASYATTRTALHGNLLSGMAEADWIDASYLAAEGTAPSGVKVTITDSTGAKYEYPTEGPKLGEIEDTKLNVPAATVFTASQYSGEEGYRMFDGSDTSKWCGSEYSNWLVFELEEARVIGQWYTMHAGSEGKGMISAAFRLQALNTEVVTEEEYLAMTDSQKKTVAKNASNWVDLDVVTGNTENEVTREIELDKLVQAQVYRFVVDDAAQPDGNSWGALRVYEMELYAYSGQLGENTNGKLKANTVETYDVSYTKVGNPVGNAVQVIVRAPSVEEVIALIDAIGTPITNDSRDAIKAARVAYDNLPEDQKELVTNYETLVQAEADYLALADAVEVLIDKIGFVTIESGEAIAAAREAYDALHPELQALVENYDTLLKAEQAYTYLLEVEELVKLAEEAKAAAEAAQKAAEEAAASSAENKEAAEKAQAAAEEAKAAAEAAQKAAEESNLAAAAEAAAAAKSAAEAAQAQAAAQAAQAAAEEAAKVAEEAKAAAEEAQKKAEEAANSAAEDKTNAKQAAEEAQAAQEAAEAAQKAAEDAQAAAEKAKEEADASNKAAAESASLAAEYAAEVAKTYAEIVEIKAELIDYLAQAQKAAEEAEAARKAAEEAQKKAEEAALAAAKYYALIEISQIDNSDLTEEQNAAAVEAIESAKAAIDEATTPEEVEAILAELTETLNAIRGLVCASDVFTDVSKDAWYHESVDFMVNSGYMNGTETDLFGTYDSLTRAQLVTILYRIAGSPSVEGQTHPFADVADGRYYTNAVIWAYNAGIVNGVSETAFDPAAEITRMQIATILYRYDGSNKVEEDHLADYADASNVPGYAVDGMNWAVANGIINGVISGEETILAPRDIATRAQIAAIIHRYLTK